MTRYTGIVAGPYSGRKMTWYERRSYAIAYAEVNDTEERLLPDVGPCIGRVFMAPTKMHLPGMPAPMVLFGLVRPLLAGRMDVSPSWDAMEAHFKRRERKQDKRLVPLPNG